MTAPTVYLDFAASTPPAPEVVRAMQDCVGDAMPFANPASTHPAGRKSAMLVAKARGQVAKLLGCNSEEILWTSGATESNNLAIQGAARARAHRGKHLITMPTEHKAVVDTFKAMEQEGFEVTWLKPEANGLLSLEVLESAIRTDTQLVSVMHVNNETGVINDVDQIGALCRARDVVYHCDAAQSVGKLPIDLSSMSIDLLSFTAHKFYGPQGVGGLYIADRPENVVAPLMFGGGQERRIRPGTLPISLLVGTGQAALLAMDRQSDDLQHMRILNTRLWDGICDLDGLVRNSAANVSYPGILNVSVSGIEGESLLLGMEPVCVASGSACNSTSGESSYVLRALGRSDLLAQSAVRFSFGNTTTTAEIDTAIERYRWSVAHLRSLAPAAVA